ATSIAREKAWSNPSRFATSESWAVSITRGPTSSAAVMARGPAAETARGAGMGTPPPPEVVVPWTEDGPLVPDPPLPVEPPPDMEVVVDPKTAPPAALFSAGAPEAIPLATPVPTAGALEFPPPPGSLTTNPMRPASATKPTTSPIRFMGGPPLVTSLGRPYPWIRFRGSGQLGRRRRPRGRPARAAAPAETMPSAASARTASITRCRGRLVVPAIAPAVADPSARRTRITAPRACLDEPAYGACRRRRGAGEAPDRRKRHVRRSGH